ncbi:MAG: putative two-component system response regulator [Erysipelotrichaceae bacterium]|nr:MAG: putative two-component system response regulator [Erysipelotrichaceae bacterium]
MEGKITKKQKNILIVDDSTEAIDVLGNALPKEYKLQFALSGKQALLFLDTSKTLPDLILLDVMMPDMNGYEVCRHLKRDDRFKNIPVIFLSALLDAKDKVRAFQNGGVDYIEKPFENQEVQARVELHMRLHDLQEQLEHYNRELNHLVESKVNEISESQMATIYALVKLAEARDLDTGRHLERIAVFCRTLAQKSREMKYYLHYIDDAYIEDLFKASPLHDIGKVSIPDKILLKPGKLTAEEFEIMKTHTTNGAKTLLEVKERYPENKFIELGRQIALTHHERWDGSGYPFGLKGDEIPLEGRIMALVDVYDALRSKRVYKEPYPHEVCVVMIAEESGLHFDPKLVEIFLKFESDFNEQCNRFL